MSTPRLDAHAPSERQEHLRRYLLACVRDSVLSWSDITSSSAYDKLLRTISKDIKSVLLSLGKEGGGGILRAVGTSLAGIAEDVVAGRRR